MLLSLKDDIAFDFIAFTSLRLWLDYGTQNKLIKIFLRHFDKLL